MASDSPDAGAAESAPENTAESAQALPETAPKTAPEELPTHLAMRHPDGGACDGYEADKKGIVFIPVGEVADLLDHGFVPAASK